MIGPGFGEAVGAQTILRIGCLVMATLIVGLLVGFLIQWDVG